MFRRLLFFLRMTVSSVGHSCDVTRIARSTDWLGVMLADEGVVSVTVWSVSSPGEMELIETSGGLKMVESKFRTCVCVMDLGGS